VSPFMKSPKSCVYANQESREFSRERVGTNLTFKALIETVRRCKSDEDLEKCKKYAVTEVIEIGDGIWEQVRSGVLLFAGCEPSLMVPPGFDG